MAHLPRLTLHCYLVGAIAEAVIVDLRENLFSYAGFPQISITSHGEGTYHIGLIWNTSQVDFELTDAEAEDAALRFKSEKMHARLLFERVQAATAKLEAKVRADKRALETVVS